MSFSVKANGGRHANWPSSVRSRTRIACESIMSPANLFFAAFCYRYEPKHRSSIHLVIIRGKGCLHASGNALENKLRCNKSNVRKRPPRIFFLVSNNVCVEKQRRVSRLMRSTTRVEYDLFHLIISKPRAPKGS